MEYWRGVMDWPIDRDWVCPTCGASRHMLIWGLMNAQCRCDNCHTQFYMRDKNLDIVETPVCLLKEEYREPAKFAFEYFKKPISKLDDDEWDYAFSQCME